MICDSADVGISGDVTTQPKEVVVLKNYVARNTIRQKIASPPGPI